MLHQHWPNEFAAGNLDVLMSLYATETGTGPGFEQAEPVYTSASEATVHWTGPPEQEAIRERYRQLLGLFGSVHTAELRVLRVDWRNPGPLGYRTTVHALIRGRSPEGDLRQLEQWATLHVRFFDPFWEISAEEVTDRTMVTQKAPRFRWSNGTIGIDSVHANQLSPVFRLFGKHADNPVRQASGVAVGTPIIRCSGRSWVPTEAASRRQH